MEYFFSTINQLALQLPILNTSGIKSSELNLNQSTFNLLTSIMAWSEKKGVEDVCLLVAFATLIAY